MSIAISLRIARTVGLLLFGAALVPVLAQQSRDTYGSPEERRADRLAVLDERLTLTPEQNAQIDSVLEANSGRLRAIREASAGDRRAFREGVREHLAELDAAIITLLTPTQQDAYTALRQEERAAQRARRGRRFEP